MGLSVSKETDNEEEYDIETIIRDVKKLGSIKYLVGDAGIAEIRISNADEIDILFENRHILANVPAILIETPHMGVMEPKKLNELRRYIKINKVRVVDIDNDSFKEIKEVYEYTPEQYEILYSKIQEIIGDIPDDFTELQKFMVVYQRLGSTISYDYEMAREGENRDKEYIEQNRYSARNLINGLIKGKCVCVGYADILYNCLKPLGIDSYKISGEKHAWNKVQIDGVWYNVDLTNDVDSIVQNDAKGLRQCLRNDINFKRGHSQERGRKVKCDIDYPRDEIENAFKFVRTALKREEDVESGFLKKLKDKITRVFDKRKRLEEKTEKISTPKTTEQRRVDWLRKGRIVLENGAEISRIDRQEEITPKTHINDREIDD